MACFYDLRDVVNNCSHLRTTIGVVATVDVAAQIEEVENVVSQSVKPANDPTPRSDKKRSVLKLRYDNGRKKSLKRFHLV